MSREMTISKAEKQAAVTLFEDASSKQAPILKALGIPPQVFARVAINALMKNPLIARCTKDSLYQAMYTACQVGLMPDGSQGAIVPIKRGNAQVAEFWPMINGLVMKVREQIPGISLQAHLVFDGDEFIDKRGTSPELTHIASPEVDRTDENTLIAAYATAHMPGNSVPEVIVMYRSELERFRKNNRGPWSGHTLEMFRVRPLKRVIKRLPITGSLLTTMADDTSDDPPAPTSVAGDVYEGTFETVSPAPADPAPPKRQTRKPRNPPPPPPEPEDDFDPEFDAAPVGQESEPADMF